MITINVISHLPLVTTKEFNNKLIFKHCEKRHEIFSYIFDDIHMM